VVHKLVESSVLQREEIFFQHDMEHDVSIRHENLFIENQLQTFSHPIVGRFISKSN
jgi:hypothetical protein